MSFLSRFFSRCSRHDGQIDARQMFIIDANGFIDKRYREANGLPSPRDNFYVLKNLAYFVQREGLEMKAVFIGRPLREAGEGEEFKGVAVYYANDDKSLSQKISRLVRSGAAHKEVVIVTDDRQIEREAMKMNAQCMRLTTLKKGMEGGFDHDRPPRPAQRRTAYSSDLPTPAIVPTPRLGGASGEAWVREVGTKAGPAAETEPQLPPVEQDNSPDEEKQNKNILDLIDPI